MAGRTVRARQRAGGRPSQGERTTLGKKSSALEKALAGQTALVCRKKWSSKGRIAIVGWAVASQEGFPGQLAIFKHMAVGGRTTLPLRRVVFYQMALGGADAHSLEDCRGPSQQCVATDASMQVGGRRRRADGFGWKHKVSQAVSSA